MEGATGIMRTVICWEGGRSETPYGDKSGQGASTIFLYRDVHLYKYPISPSYPSFLEGSLDYVGVTVFNIEKYAVRNASK